MRDRASGGGGGGGGPSSTFLSPMLLLLLPIPTSVTNQQRDKKELWTRDFWEIFYNFMGYNVSFCSHS